MKMLRFAMLASLAAVVLGIASPIPVAAGSPPNRLDDNRGNAALAATVSAGLSAFIHRVARLESALHPAETTFNGELYRHPYLGEL